MNYWLTDFDVTGVDNDDVRWSALQWAMLHGSGSGRSAYHFAKDWAGRTGLGNE